MVDNVRLRLLRFLNADPDCFDVVFVANATAAIKLIADTFRDLPGGFWYGYHRDAHTSLVGVRELASRHQCFETDREVNEWIKSRVRAEGLGILAYPAQSNMNGRRLPLRWSHELRQAEDTRNEGRIFTLLDAAAILSTSPLDLSDSKQAPDFTVLSLYKIFGFPDLGALVVRKDAGWVFQHRKYFGGGTVDMVLSLKEQWHAKKVDSIHSQLEDGTLPIHSIIALDSAFTVHTELFQSLARVARHTGYLADRLHRGLTRLRHGNGRPLVQLYKDDTSHYRDTCSQGPVVSFTLRNDDDTFVSNNEVEKLASIRNIHIRTGGLCNPGGIASALSLKPWDMRKNFSTGQHKCGSENDIIDGKPTGMIRASLGAMSTTSDVDSFLAFLKEFFLNDNNTTPREEAVPELGSSCELVVESLTVYPIKSCAGWQVPFDTPWLVRPEGLAWDREWCLVHQGTNKALSQKRYPKMALIKPSLDFDQGLLRVRLTDSHNPHAEELTIPLSSDPRPFQSTEKTQPRLADVCGDTFEPRMYASTSLATCLSDFIGVPCQLARFPPMGSAGTSTRHAKAHLKTNNDIERKRPILLSNESPILTINRSSLNRLNEIIKADFGKAASPSVFRANIVLAEPWNTPSGFEQPYAEDRWTRMRIGHETFEFLGGCRRCQMVCIDQGTAVKNEQPFVTLAKTRRFGGKVLFGVHTCLLPRSGASCATIRVGDAVTSFSGDELL